MSSLFNKIGNSATSLFNKVSSQAPTMYRKFQNTVRKVDNSVGRVGSFISNTANSLGIPAISALTKTITNGIHQGRIGMSNALEKAVKADISEIRKDFV